MRLLIRTNSLRNAQLPRTIVGEFDERGGTIGRSDSNTMTLPDPERHVSRLQAEISFAAGAFSIRNVGSSNPIFVEGRPVNPGEAVVLRHGEFMTIGDYELQVLQDGAHDLQAGGKAMDAKTVIGASAGEGKTSPPRQANPSTGTLHPYAPLPAADPFADLFDGPASLSAADPFDGLLGASPPRAAVGLAKPISAQASPSPSARLPDDFDPFADISPPPPAVPEQGQALADIVGERRSAPGSLDAIFGLDAATPQARDPLEAFLGAALEGSAASSKDPFAFLDEGMSPTPAVVGPAEADDTPELRGAYLPPPVLGPLPSLPREPSPMLGPAPLQPPALQAPVGGDSSTDELWSAFCDGAQLSLTGQQRLTPELMRLIGSTLQQAVEGIVQLNIVRTTAKQELSVPVTTIQSKNNNPLKFAPDASVALLQLLQPPIRGFMAAPEAVQDSMADLLGHAVGTMAGTRAAIQGMLKRFEPAQLESQLARGGMLDTLLPMNRRARLWELYLQHYVRISESAREDFHDLFGKAFVKAYEEQADRIADSRRAPR